MTGAKKILCDIPCEINDHSRVTSIDRYSVWVYDLYLNLSYIIISLKG